ncbi:HD domain-containing protein [Parabacteroides sp. Marseille-P3160]|uniref:HD domain-containing protein n=1 Tax=Parabacteroides sp. Marseille-P3160 TaxID=1917887 RepID=UPI0009BAC1E7|nr:HD domain-containing protein [Parabacteroides sp. Marseille-P3160]
MTITPQHLETAIQIATKAHMGQVDKAGKPYILHPLRIMANVHSTEEKIAAVLHDVIEDTDLDFPDLLSKGIPSEIVDVLRLLTHEEGIDYEDYIKRLSVNTIARAVKIADLKDNSNLSRLPKIGKKDIERVEKYKKALSFLGA